MKEKQIKHKKKPIKITRINAHAFGVTIVMGIVFVCLIVISANAFKVVESTSQQYITCEEDAKLLQDASNYLTEQARLFVATGEKKYMDAYFKEADVTKRREKAVESLGEYFANTDSMVALEAALDSSINLMELEYQAMHAAASAYGFSEDELPEQVISADISTADVNDKEALRQVAIHILAGDDYQKAKDTINADVEECMKDLITETDKAQLRAIRVYQRTQLIMIVVGIVLVFCMLWSCAFTYKAIVIPLKLHEKSIKANETLKVEGVAELQALAVTFNKVFKEHQDAMRIIRHEAEHDELTGAYNRRSFNKFLSIYEEGNGDFALLIVDVDTFKTINDSYGHTIGDSVLVRVAEVLKASFRGSDHVCRIGGDEFAVIVANVNEKHIGVIKTNITNINQILGHPTDGLPPVTISVGGAISGSSAEKIFVRADGALYKVKNSGRKGCRFAEEMD